MAKRAYSEVNLHIVWRVKENFPVLKDEIESQLHRFLRGRAVHEDGVFWHDSGGTDDHVHLVVTIPPTIQISEWIGQLKGASSHFINHEIVNRKLLEWQAGYGVVSFGSKDLGWVLDYVRSQRSHHAMGRIHDRLERIETEDDKPPEGG
ncbi:MAG: IS200/IS605 family transposase [Phycisphaerae bacterium]|nr:IS200/IS605 family transposase [Phycisphaerae bacterium]